MRITNDTNKIHMKAEEVYKNFGYENGKELKIKWNNSSDASVWGDIWLPVKVVKEYKKFILFEVLPHNNPNGQGTSTPYRMCANKGSIYMKGMEIKE